MFRLGGAETQDSIFKILECIEVVKYAVRIMHIVMVAPVCSIAYKNITIGTRNEAK